MEVGKSIHRVDAFDKVCGRAKYTEDLTPPNTLVVRLVRSTIAHGEVLRLDLEQALLVPGVVKIVTCFDVPERPFPTAGHPWSTDPKHQDVADRCLLNRRVHIYGDEIAAVIAHDEVCATRAARLVRAEYKEYPVMTTPAQALSEGAVPIHPELRETNLLAHSHFVIGEGTYEQAVAGEDGLVLFDQTYSTQTVQHCHLEPPISVAWMEAGGRVTVVSSTQIPHIARRVVAQA
ncbi:MAG: molybdopterin cofactor-binding domain-containing protein, partial [Oscillospiraceae bacterium]